MSCLHILSGLSHRNVSRGISCVKNPVNDSGEWFLLDNLGSNRILFICLIQSKTPDCSWFVEYSGFKPFWLQGTPWLRTTVLGKIKYPSIYMSSWKKYTNGFGRSMEICNKHVNDLFVFTCSKSIAFFFRAVTIWETFSYLSLILVAVVSIDAFCFFLKHLCNLSYHSKVWGH